MNQIEINIQNHGFILDEIQPENYVLGGKTKLKKKVLVDNGHWDKKYLPTIREIQLKNRLETFNCTGFGLENCVSTIYKRKFGEEVNYSERQIGIGAKTRPPGNSPNKVVESARKEFGFIDERLLPFSDDIKTVEQYFSPDPLPNHLIEIGKQWIKKYKLGYEQVFNNKDYIKIKQEKLIEGLRFSPIGISVLAWKKRNNKYFKEDQELDNHFCMLFDYEKFKSWFIYDSYDSIVKELEWNYNFNQALLYTLDMNKFAADLSFFQILEQLFKRFLRYG